MLRSTASVLLYLLPATCFCQDAGSNSAITAAQLDRQWDASAFVTPYAPNLSDEEKLAGLSELWAQAKFGFANFWHVPQLDWDQTYSAFIPQVLATKSTLQYYRILQRFYALLQDGHSNVYPPDQLNISPMPLVTRLVEGRLLILGKRIPGFDLQGLHPGDEILTINGEPAITWAKRQVEPFVSASSPQDRDNRTFGHNLFEAPEGTTFQITTGTPAGVRTSHTLTVPPYQAPQTPHFEFRMLPDGVAYVALNSFGDNIAAKEWDAHWPEISKATSLILDVRENEGGSTSVGSHILASLITKSSLGELSRLTKWVAAYRAWGDPETPVQPPVDMIEPDAARHFSGPVVMLASPRTFSAGEDMVVAFAQAHRGPLIGEATAGSTGQPLVFKLPGGGTARICAKHDSFADGRDFVGSGVTPDVVVHTTRRDVVAGYDPVMERARQWLQNALRDGLGH
jgi:carboxyl-terminal processing protease